VSEQTTQNNKTMKDYETLGTLHVSLNYGDGTVESTEIVQMPGYLALGDALYSLADALSFQTSNAYDAAEGDILSRIANGETEGETAGHAWVFFPAAR
jgi:predicted aspartyl protease